ncbi:MAG TPA: OmpA family protein [Ferruginibacter sp.]|nr:OmpA family protein [Ferruginibacter sp.]
MKKNLILLSFTLLSLSNSIAQTDVSKEAADVADNSYYNRWTIEVTGGQAKGTKPYTDGYFSSNPDRVLGTFVFNSFSIGTRYMFSPKFGLKADFTSDLFTNYKNSDSKYFRVQQYRYGVHAVVNASRLLNVERKLGRVGILINGGLVWSRMTPKYGIWDGHTENNLGVMFGITPGVRITKKLAVNINFSSMANIRQHFTWNGLYSDEDNNLSGQMLSGTFGLSYSLGKGKLHGDWAIIEDKRLGEIELLDKRVGELETMMDDTDKDGVPDYLDVENNSIAGVAVDTKGRMVDINKNGVPDELEKFLSDTYVDKTGMATQAAQNNAELIKRLINEGYVTTYFDYNKTKPTNVSTEGIDFILTYMRNNPSATIDIVGHADEIGKTSYNEKLSNDRANNVKNTLIKAGVSPSRLNIVSKGEDTTVDPTSTEARRLVRRVTFKVKD